MKTFEALFTNPNWPSPTPSHNSFENTSAQQGLKNFFLVLTIYSNIMFLYFITAGECNISWIIRYSCQGNYPIRIRIQMSWFQFEQKGIGGQVSFKPLIKCCNTIVYTKI